MAINRFLNRAVLADGDVSYIRTCNCGKLGVDEISLIQGEDYVIGEEHEYGQA
ncbi:hypothetical protein DSUL_60100 [Desulfovibrionales bacterium]